jgi:hypothetical protein
MIDHLHKNPPMQPSCRQSQDYKSVHQKLMYVKLSVALVGELLSLHSIHVQKLKGG